MISIEESFKKSCLEMFALVERMPLTAENVPRLVLINGVYFVNKPEFNSKLNELVMQILDESAYINENYTSKYLKEKIRDYIFNLDIEPPANISDSINQFSVTFFSELQQNVTDFKIPLLIENLQLNEKITLGYVDFVPFSDEFYSNVFFDQGYQPMQGLDFSKVEVSKEEREKIGSIAVIDVMAGDNEKALEKALDLMEDSLNVIRLFFCGHNFGILGSCANINRLYTGVYNKKNGSFSSRRWDFTNFSNPCELNLAKVEAQKDQGLNNVIKILKKKDSERTSMEKKLINSISWFGEVIKNRKNTENLIRLFICLESLVIGKGENKKFNLAERIPILNHDNENDRDQIKLFIKRMYKERGNLVHEGFTNFEDADFHSLLGESRSCIINIAKNIDTLNDFEDFKNLISTREELP